MDLLLKERLALVTGSTAGIGLAIAEGLARENATVIVNGRFKPRVANAVEMIRQKYPGRNDSLWVHENCAAGNLTRSC